MPPLSGRQSASLLRPAMIESPLLCSTIFFLLLCNQFVYLLFTTSTLSNTRRSRSIVSWLKLTNSFDPQRTICLVDLLGVWFGIFFSVFFCSLWVSFNWENCQKAMTATTITEFSPQSEGCNKLWTPPPSDALTAWMNLGFKKIRLHSRGWWWSIFPVRSFNITAFIFKDMGLSFVLFTFTPPFHHCEDK